MLQKVESVGSFREAIEAHCRDCKWSKSGDAKEFRKVAAGARYHSASTGHTIDVYRENRSYVTPVSK